MVDVSDGTELMGKVALVTGAGSRGAGFGIGKATAVLLARRGARVGLVDNDLERAEETARLIADEGGASMCVVADVTDSDACARAVGAVVDAYGRLDILVNVVGIEGALGDVTTVDPAEWDAGLKVNVTSMVLMAKHAVPALARDGGGAIVNISSVAGMYAGLSSVLYPASKAAVNMLTRSMALHHGRQGIRVNAVAPGLVFTPMVGGDDLDPTFRAARREAGMLGTEGTAWDVAEAVGFLVSDRARWITAVTLPVDAGLTAKVPIPNPAYPEGS